MFVLDKNCLRQKSHLSQKWSLRANFVIVWTFGICQVILIFDFIELL